MRASYNLMMLPMLLAVTVLLISAIPAPAGASPLKDEGTVTYNNNHKILIGSFPSAKDLQVKVTTNASVDVYLLTAEESFLYPDSFTPTRSFEKTKSVDFKFSPDTTTSYYVIIDNQDNSRSTDQVPVGDVTFSAEYPDPADSITDNVESVFNTCLLGIITVVIIIVIVIVVIIYFVVRDKPKPQQQVPMVQAPYVPPATYQPVPVQPVQYQPQPGQYSAPPQAPSAYSQAPLPPSAYEPPPPPPPGAQYPPK